MFYIIRIQKQFITEVIRIRIEALNELRTNQSLPCSVKCHSLIRPMIFSLSRESLNRGRAVSVLFRLSLGVRWVEKLWAVREKMEGDAQLTRARFLEEVKIMQLPHIGRNSRKGLSGTGLGQIKSRVRTWRIVISKWQLKNVTQAVGLMLRLKLITTNLNKNQIYNNT